MADDVRQILIAEDETVVAMDLRFTLEGFGYTVTEVVASGRQAVESARRSRPDLVMMDIQLRGDMDGIDAARLLRTELDVPVIFLTAYGDDSTLQRAKSAHPFAFLLKPYQERELHSMVEVALHNHAKERQLRERERWLETILHGIGDGIVAADRSGRITYINRRAQELLGTAAPDATGSALDDVLPAGDALNDPHASDTQPDGSVTSRAELSDPTGRVREVELTRNPVLVEGDRVGTVVVVRDLELRRRAERAEALRASEERMRAMIEHGSDMILVLDAEGRICEASQSIERIFQYKQEWMKGLQILEHIHPDDQADARDALADVLREPGRSAQHEFRVRRRDGSFAAVDIIGKNLTHHPLIGGIVVNARDVTERRVIEDALRRSEHDYRGVFESAHDPILIFDPDTEIVYDANQRACEVYGLERDELIGISMRSVTADVARGRAELEVLRSTGRITGFETVHYLADGTPMRFEINASLVEYQGRPAVLSINRDVTQRHRAELELRRSHGRLAMVSTVWRAVTLVSTTAEIARKTLEAAQPLIPFDRAGVVTIEPQTGSARLLATVGTVDHLGLHDGDVLRNLDLDTMAADSKATITHRAGAAGATDTRWIYDLHEDVASCIHCTLTRDGQVVGSVFFVATASDRFENEHLLVVRDLVFPLTAALQALDLRAEIEQHNRRMERLVDRLPEGVALLDNEHRPQIINARATHLLGLLSGAGPGEPINAMAGEPIEQVLDTARGPIPVRVTARDEASETIIEISAAAIEGDHETAGHIVLLRDVSRDVERQRKLEQQDRLAAVGQLAAGIAHDFNNMLQAISGFAELIQFEEDAPEPVLVMAQGMRTQAQRGAQLVRQILDFSRKSTSTRRHVALDAVLEESLVMLEHTIPESIRIVPEIKPGDYGVLADVTQIQQVITNLAVNARDAMPEGGQLTIGLSRERLEDDASRPNPSMADGDWILLTISDTGTGVDPDVQARLFEPFVTTKPPGEGTGLGLAQAYGIVTRHEGYLTFTTSPGKGSSFSVYLPPNIAPSSDLGAERSGQLVNGRKRRVLLVEDAPLVRSATVKTLRRFGFDPHAAADGEEALDMLAREEYRFDFIVTDVVMPGIGGVELRQRLIARGIDIPTVFVSGFDLTGEGRDAVDSPRVTWLEKPFTAEQLSDALQDLGHDRPASGE